MRERRFLPFDQIDEDPARAELDRRLLVDVLGLPESLVAPDGPVDLLRRKLAREPQIHGGKKTRVSSTMLAKGPARRGKNAGGTGRRRHEFRREKVQKRKSASRYQSIPTFGI